MLAALRAAESDRITGVAEKVPSGGRRWLLALLGGVALTLVIVAVISVVDMLTR